MTESSESQRGADAGNSTAEDESYVTSFGATVTTAVGQVLTGNVIGRALGFAGNVLTARVIGASGFGLLGMVRSTMSLGSSLTGMGVGGTASRYIPRWRDADEGQLGQLLGLVLIVAVVGSAITGGALLWLTPFLTREVYATPALAPLFVAAVPWVMAKVVGMLTTKVLRGYEKFETLAIVRVVRGALAVVLLAGVLLLWRSTAVGAVLALGAVEIGVTLLLLGAVWREIAQNGSADVRWPSVGVVAEPLRQYALPAYGFVLLQTPVSWFLLTRLARAEHGTEFVGAVQATGSFRGAMAMLPAALATTLLPSLSRLHSLASAEVFSKRVRRMVRILWLFALSGGVLVAAALPFLMEIVFGKSFGMYAAACAVLLWVTSWSIVNEVFDRLLAAVGEMWLSFALGLGYSVGVIALTVLLVPRFHLWGYVLSQFTAMAGYVIVQQEIVGRWIDYNSRERWITVGIALLGGCISITLGAFATPLQAALGAVALSTSFAAVGWKLLLGEGERRFVEIELRTAIDKALTGVRR